MPAISTARCKCSPTQSGTILTKRERSLPETLNESTRNLRSAAIAQQLIYLQVDAPKNLDAAVFNLQYMYLSLHHDLSADELMCMATPADQLDADGSQTVAVAVHSPDFTDC
eukprot:TRINITY_DN24356_c0_g1_i1.p1 TRINITY_DN24356_c0_g1~~TRINITY_DN24356_c0_g1_i1.p1  ORF type:complete len:112 (-),score=18.03 TRINITY_DN24356_c0_g1_i1:418-753(-)